MGFSLMPEAEVAKHTQKEYSGFYSKIMQNLVYNIEVIHKNLKKRKEINNGN